ncbi:hypothetical protein ACROYT_G043674 [Oculina patagonica]
MSVVALRSFAFDKYITGDHVDDASYQLNAFGKDWTLDIKRNKELFSPSFAVRTFANDGSEVIQEGVSDHCHYQGTIRGLKDSSVVLNTCSGLRGLIDDGKDTFYITPDTGLESDGAHKVFQAKEDDFNHILNACGNKETHADSHPSKENAGTFSRIQRSISNMDAIYKPYLTTDETRYNELLLVADFRMFKQYNNDTKALTDHVITLANAVDAIYQRINIRVVMKALEIWTNGDPYERASTGGADLSRFNTYRKDHLLKKFPHDNAQLLSSWWWEDCAGMAYVFGMCGGVSSGINGWSFGSIIGPYVTVAHEMGHNFGFSHDTGYCKCLTPRGCFMGGHKTRVPGFSNCSLESLKRLNDWCLYNVPTYKAHNSYCGNGIREEGEECDCGTPEMCMAKDPCCEPHNCVLKKESQCSDLHHTCCEKCLYKKQGSLCRGVKTDCDVPEYCPGDSRDCPEDTFIINGYPCNQTQTVIQGNTNYYSVKSRNLNPRISARYVRISPQYWYGWPCLRTEFMGCAAGEVSPSAPTPLKSYGLDFCLTPSNKTCSPGDNDPLIYISGGLCSESHLQFELGSDGVLRHTCSGKMVCPENGGTHNGARIVVSSTCTVENSKFERTAEKGKQQEKITDNLEETVPTAGGLRLPVITSPADIYKHFSRRVTFQDEIRESFRETDTSISDDIGSRENVSDSDDQLSDEDKEQFSSHTQRTGTSCPGHTVKKMFSQETTEEMAADIFQSYQQTLNNLAQKMLVKDVKIDKFHGRDNEDISRWFEKLELLLTTKGIDKTGPLALAQIINNLSGPAETFLFELPAEERESFEKLKSALMKRYDTKDRTWVKRQRLITRRQGSNELLSDYINDMHELFSGLQVAEVDKVSYFIEGLIPSLKVKVLERMPETLLEAEECARTLDSINKRVNQDSDSSQIERLINALMVSGQAPPVATATSAQPVDKQIQSLNTKLDVLAKRDSQQGVARLIRELREDLLDELQQQDRRLNARISGLARGGYGNRYEYQQLRERTRYGRPTCYNCGVAGHFEQNCPQREYYQTGNHYTAHEPVQRQNPRGYQYYSEYQPRRREIMPPNRQTGALTNPGANPPCIGTFSTVNADLSATMAQHTEGTARRAGRTLPKQKQENPVNESQAKGSVPIVQKKEVPSQDHEPTSVQSQEIHPNIGEVTRARNTSPENRSNVRPTNPANNFVPLQSQPPNEASVPENLSQSARAPKPVVASQSNDECPQPQNPKMTSNHRAVLNRNARSFYGSGLAIRSNPPVFDTPQNEAFVNAFTHCTENKPFRKHWNRSSSQRRKIRDVHRQARNSRQQESAKLPDPIKETRSVKNSDSVTRPNVDQKQEVEREVSISHKEASPPGHVHNRNNSGMKNGVHRQTMLPEKTTTELKTSDLTMVGDIEGHSIELLVDTGACVSAMAEQVVKKIYGHRPARMTDGFVPSVKTINGERVPILGKIEVPLKINGIQYQGQFHVMQSLTHEAILGQDFLQENGAVIDLGNSCLTLNDRPMKLKKPSASGSDRVMGTFVLPSSKKAALERNSSANGDKERKPKANPKREKYHKSNYQFISSFWILILVVFYLFMTSQAQRLDELRPTERQSKEGESCSATRDEVKTQDKVSVPFREHPSCSFTKIIANDWHDAYKDDGYKPYFAHLADNPNHTDDACDTSQLMNKDQLFENVADAMLNDNFSNTRTTR